MSGDGAAGTGTPRVLVVWCPDWPVVAVERPGDAGAAAGGDTDGSGGAAAGRDGGTPVAVVEGGRVLACSAAARAAGVRQGQRLKLAQRLCPALELRDRDPEAETRRFEPVVAAVEAFTPRVEVLRPGLCAIPVKGPGRYFGGEEALAAKVQGAVTAALAATAPGAAATADPAEPGRQEHPADAETAAARPAARPAAHPGTRSGDRTSASGAEDVPVAEVVPLHPADAGRAAPRRRTAGSDELFDAAPAARDGARGGFARPAAYPSEPVRPEPVRPEPARPDHPAGPEPVHPSGPRPAVAGHPGEAAHPESRPAESRPAESRTAESRTAPGPAPGPAPAPAPAPAPRGQVGVADGLFAAVLAARAGVLVPAGRTAEFLAPYPVAALGDEVLAELLDRLGLPTVGTFAALPAEAVADRFGPAGTTAHRLARGLQPRPLAPRTGGPNLSVEQRFDPPEPLAEPLVFVARTLAEQLHQRLAGAGLTCQRVAVEVECADGRTVARLWRHEGRLSATALAERVRWQLQAWQSAGTFEAAPAAGPRGTRPPGGTRPHDGSFSPNGLRPTEGADGPGTGGFTALRLVPDDLTPDRGRQLALWGQAVADDRVERAVARVQAVLGHAGLRRIEPAGGRGPDEQAVRVPWGEPYDPAAPADAPWPGRLRDVWPSVVHRTPVPATVLDADGRPVTVDGRAGVSARPATVAVRGRRLAVDGWTGPWPVVEYWWDRSRARRRARFQVTVAGGRALLLTVEGGAWFMEAGYD
ncbi:Y-family DNA polymerase [Kitasatospora sp. NBC_00458]|uniref:Y-family DNA polymerase n=1 Tax=Kitasatospora sp. NBC_00458 TaxID=2903568 RepID=UPI002E18976F